MSQKQKGQQFMGVDRSLSCVKNANGSQLVLWIELHRDPVTHAGLVSSVFCVCVFVCACMRMCATTPGVGPLTSGSLVH